MAAFERAVDLGYRLPRDRCPGDRGRRGRSPSTTQTLDRVTDRPVASTSCRGTRCAGPVSAAANRSRRWPRCSTTWPQVRVNLDMKSHRRHPADHRRDHAARRRPIACASARSRAAHRRRCARLGPELCTALRAGGSCVAATHVARSLHAAHRACRCRHGCATGRSCTERFLAARARPRAAGARLDRQRRSRDDQAARPRRRRADDRPSRPAARGADRTRRNGQLTDTPSMADRRCGTPGWYLYGWASQTSPRWSRPCSCRAT